MTQRVKLAIAAGAAFVLLLWFVVAIKWYGDSRAAECHAAIASCRAALPDEPEIARRRVLSARGICSIDSRAELDAIENEVNQLGMQPSKAKTAAKRAAELAAARLEATNDAAEAKIRDAATAANKKKSPAERVAALGQCAKLVNAVHIDIRLVAKDASVVSELQIQIALPEAVVFQGRVFVFAGFEGGHALFREVRAHLVIEGELE